jgi:hypothetical protein
MILEAPPESSLLGPSDWTTPVMMPAHPMENCAAADLGLLNPCGWTAQNTSSLSAEDCTARQNSSHSQNSVL